MKNNEKHDLKNDELEHVLNDKESMKEINKLLKLDLPEIEIDLTDIDELLVMAF